MLGVDPTKLKGQKDQQAGRAQQGYPAQTRRYVPFITQRRQAGTIAKQLINQQAGMQTYQRQNGVAGVAVVIGKPGLINIHQLAQGAGHIVRPHDAKSQQAEQWEKQIGIEVAELPAKVIPPGDKRQRGYQRTEAPNNNQAKFVF